MTFQRILITGANGLLGQELVRQLSSVPECDVLATGKDKAPLYGSASAGYAQMDITDMPRVKQIVDDFAPQVIVNCAAITGVDLCESERELCWQVNAEAVEQLVKICRPLSTRIVQVSTDFVFDGQNGPYSEDARPNPVNFYGKSKLAAENAVRQLDPAKWAIARTVMVYGTGEKLRHSNIALWIINSLSKGQSIRVFKDQLRSPSYVVDLANGIAKIVRFKRHGVYNVSGREYITIHEFAETVADVFELDATLIEPIDSGELELEAARPPKTGFIVLKAETELSFRPRPLRLALEDMRSRMSIPIAT